MSYTIEITRIFLILKMLSLRRISRGLRTFYTYHGDKESSFKLVATLDDGSTLFRLTPTPAQSIETAKPHSLESLPPRVRTFPPRTKLSLEQIDEMKILRSSDPDINTVLQLARKFNTYPGFVLKHTSCPPERKQRLISQETIAFEALSLSKKKRALDRIRRKDLW